MLLPPSTATAPLRWFVRDARSGHVEIRGRTGEAIAATLSPGYEPLFAPDHPPGQTVAVQLVAEDGSVTALEATRVPGLADTAVAWEPPCLERALAPLVETMVNQIAHDVRNYAFTIGLQAELGDRRAEALPEVKGHFASVLRQIDALRKYLDSLLVYGRPVTLRPARLDVGGFVRQQVQTLQFGWRADAPPLAITVEVAADAGDARWDAGRLGHAVQALLDNAVRSADPAPQVTVTVTRSGAEITLAIADSGTGIDADKLHLIWQPMRVRRHGGLGLGLAIAKKMVAAHAGSIELASSPQGTTVRLVLPAEAPAG
jgi:signal transduction histidine kinase